MDLLPLLSVWDSFMGFLSVLIQPLYHAVSGIVVFFYWVWAPVFGKDSGWTWTLAIASLTIVIRTLLIPLFVRQIRSARNMQLLQPKMKALQDKYGADRERLGQETMKLYREEGVNPTASCLPLLLQAPIFLALFRVLDGASRVPATPRGYFFVQNPDLVASLQGASIFGAKIAGTFLPLDDFGATQILALVLILAMTGILFITQLQLMQKNMPPAALEGPMAQQQKMMLYLFPVIYAIGGVSIPIGVLIYWLVSNLWTMGQQYILIHRNPTPGTPAYVDWEERMRAKGLDPAQLQADRDARGRRRRPVASVTPAPAVATSGDGAAEGTQGARPAVQRQQIQRQQVNRPAGRVQPKKQPRSDRRDK